MAVRFDAAADRLARTSGLLNTNAAYTAAFWLWASSDLNAYGHVFGTNINSASNHFEYFGFDDNNVGGTLPRLCLLVDNGAYVEVSGSRLALSTWHYIVLIRSSTTNLSLYLNASTTPDITNTQNVSARTTATRMELGAFGTGNGDRFDGRIANLKIWDTNLTAQEAADERFTVEPLRKTNLWGWYPLLSSSDVADWSGNGRDWTAGGTLTTEDHPPRPFTLFVPQLPFAVVAGGGGSPAELTSAVTAATVTPDNVTSTAAGDLISAVTAATTTPDNVTSTAARALTSTVTAASVTPDTVSSVGYSQFELETFDGGDPDFNRVVIPRVDGSNAYSTNVGAGNFTFEMHAVTPYADNATQVTDVRDSNCMVDLDVWADARGFVIGVTRRTTGELVACFGQAGSGLTWVTIRGSIDIGDGNRHHIAVTRNRTTGLVAIWIDGVLDVSGTYDTNDWSLPIGYTNGSGRNNRDIVLWQEKHGVGTGAVGRFDEFRISTVVRYTTSFTPARYLPNDEYTAGLYRFDEGSGTTVLDSSGNADGVDGTIEYGGSPAGPVYVGIDGDVEVPRELTSAVTGATVTPNNVTSTAARALTSAVTGASATPDNVTATTTRALTSAVTGSSATPDNVTATTTRALTSAVTGATVTPDTVDSSGADDVALESVVTAASVTPDNVTSTATRAITSTVTGASTTPDNVTATVTRALTSAVTATSTTPDNVTSTGTGEAALTSAVTAATVTPDNVTSTFTAALTSSVTVTSSTPDAVSTTVTIALTSTISAATTTPDNVTSTVARGVSSAIVAATVTPDTVTSTTVRTVTSTVTAVSVTPDNVTSALPATAVGLVTISAVATPPSVSAVATPPSISVEV